MNVLDLTLSQTTLKMAGCLPYMTHSSTDLHTCDPKLVEPQLVYPKLSHDHHETLQTWEPLLALFQLPVFRVKKCGGEPWFNPSNSHPRQKYRSRLRKTNESLLWGLCIWHWRTRVVPHCLKCDSCIFEQLPYIYAHIYIFRIIEIYCNEYI